MPGHPACEILQDLLDTMHTLRAPGGCPWDAEQTPASLAPYILEEACEVIEAIETGKPQRIADELGDLLLQIIFQAEIHSELGLFDFADIAYLINQKLLRRHPHVFDGPNNEMTSQVDLDIQWEEIKRLELKERNDPAARHPVGRLPDHLPALQRAQKLITRARRTQLSLEYPVSGIPSLQEQIGARLFSLVQEAEELGIDAEQALRQTVRATLQKMGEATDLSEPGQFRE